MRMQRKIVTVLASVMFMGVATLATPSMAFADVGHNVTSSKVATAAIVQQGDTWAFTECIFGTGVPIGATIGMALSPSTWYALGVGTYVITRQPMGAASMANRVIGWCSKAMR